MGFKVIGKVIRRKATPAMIMAALGTFGCRASLNTDDFTFGTAQGGTVAAAGPDSAVQEQAPEREDAAGADAQTDSPLVPTSPLPTPSPTPLASEIPDCLVESRRFPDKDPRLTVFQGETEYGEAEWREGMFGACVNKQWIEFDVVNPIPGPLVLHYVTIDGTFTGVGYSFPDGLPAGPFHGPILDDDRVICGLLGLPEQPRETWPVFGNFSMRAPRPNPMAGTMC